MTQQVKVLATKTLNLLIPRIHDGRKLTPQNCPVTAVPTQIRDKRRALERWLNG